MRRRARVDSNQAEITAALRKAGASVQPLHSIGKGCPDLLVGFRGRNLLFEVKDGNKPPSAQELTPDGFKWSRMWIGQYHIVRSADEALACLVGICKG